MQDREKATESFALQAIGWSIIIMGMLYILMQARLPVPRHGQPQHANPIPKPHTPTFVSDSVHQQNIQLMNEWKTSPPTYQEYDSFMDIPAGQTDTIIIVAGKTYKMGDNAWMPNQTP